MSLLVHQRHINQSQMKQLQHGIKGDKKMKINVKQKDCKFIIKPEERITAVNPIEKLTPELKNHRTTRRDTDAASGRNLTVDEKIDAVAKHVLDKYRPAFEELAK